MAERADLPDAPASPQPLRQVLRALIPRPVRAGLHAAVVAPTRWPGVIVRQARRVRWRLAETMTPPRQPGLFFWQARRSLGRVPVMWGRLLYRLRRQGAAPAAPGARFDKPSFQDALSRLQSHDLGVRSIINIGAGSGGDTEFVQRAWPGARTLLVEMDARFEPDFQRLKASIPDLAWEICAAGPHDGMGAMSKTTAVGGSIDPDGDMASSTPVQFKRIDTLVREHALEAPYFLRFDTHGFELDVLAGATEALANTALIMMEVYNFKLAFTKGRNLTFDEMSLHMKSLGFRCIDICDPLFRPGDHALWQMHLFFIRADHPVFANPGFSAPARTPRA